MESPKGDVITARFGAEDVSSSELRTIRRPISAIVEEIVVHIEEIVRSEVRLARVEISDEIGKAIKQSIKACAAIVLLIYALGFLFWGAAYGLAQVIPLWLAAVAIGAILAVATALLWRSVRRNLIPIRLEKTTQTLKENLAWIKKPMP